MKPSKPVRSEKQVGPIPRQRKKKTIFDSDTTYNQILKSKLAVRGKSPQKKSAVKRRPSPLNVRVPPQSQIRQKSYVPESAYAESRRTESDPYGEIYDYSQIFKGESEEPSQLGGFDRQEPKANVPFKNFVEDMAQRGSISNKQWPGTGSNENGKMEITAEIDKINTNLQKLNFKHKTSAQPTDSEFFHGRLHTGGPES